MGTEGNGGTTATTSSTTTRTSRTTSSSTSTTTTTTTTTKKNSNSNNNNTTTTGTCFGDLLFLVVDGFDDLEGREGREEGTQAVFIGRKQLLAGKKRGKLKRGKDEK
jgi:hypothetical protein